MITENWKPSASGTRVLDSGGQVVCKLTWISGASRKERINLISAAPDLLEACKSFLEAINEGTVSKMSAVSKARAAIAKAYGE